MNIRNKLNYVCLLIVIATGILLLTCSNPQTSETPSEPGIPSGPGEITVQEPEVLPDNRVDVVYFHMPWRCVTCLCFEERISHVVNTDFQNELTSDKLTFTVCDIADRSKAALIRKYDAFASQLFINTVIDDADNIVNIEDIWNWGCERDKQGFDARVRDIIEEALAKVS